MNHLAFDELAALMATRRLALRGGAALLLGYSQLTDEAEAACRAPGARCSQRRKCCSGGRCRRGRCRCKPGAPLWAGTCCRERFSEIDTGQDPSEGTPVCCEAANVCRKSADPSLDDCCLENEVCINGECCCDGCRGTVVCGGTCCAETACCEGVCCGADQVCAETAPGVRSCVSAERSCGACFPGETCRDGDCCAGNRVCSEFTGTNPPVEICCGAGEYCDSGFTCCPVGVGCSTGRKVRIRV